ncbi:MAG: molybdate ABC transporter substrate-binding protein [Pseudomonadota bacterium]
MLLRLVCFVSVLIASVATAQGRDVKVFAAASLSDAMAAVAEAFAQQSEHRIKLVLAGSSTLARQIEAGADADVFLSADEEWMDYLADRKLIDRSSQRPLLKNSLVLVVPGGQNAKLAIAADSKWLTQIGQGRIAVGDPAHVPVGKYAMAALKALGAWPVVRRRLATALDTRAALALVERGEAVAGIVYATDARASQSVTIAGQFPQAISSSIAYPVARLAAKDNPVVNAAYRFITGPKAGRIFRHYGFGLQ